MNWVELKGRVTRQDNLTGTQEIGDGVALVNVEAIAYIACHPDDPDKATIHFISGAHAEFDVSYQELTGMINPKTTRPIVSCG